MLICIYLYRFMLCESLVLLPYIHIENDMNKTTQPPSMLRRRDVEARTGLGRSAIYKLMKAGTFPAQVKLGIGVCVAWVATDVDQWVQDQIANGRHILPKDSSATENFLHAQLERGAVPKLILKERAEAYGIAWESIETALHDGLVTTESVNGMTTPLWRLS